MTESYFNNYGLFSKQTVELMPKHALEEIIMFLHLY